MDRYFELKRILDNEEVISNEVFISAYDLKEIILEKLKDLYEIIHVDKAIEKINKKENIVSNIYNRLSFLFNDLKNEKRFNLKSIELTSDDKIIIISFSLKNLWNEHYTYFDIIKLRKSNELLFKETTSLRPIALPRTLKVNEKKFISENFEYINKVIETLEFFHDQYGINVFCNKIKLKNDLLKSNDYFSLKIDLSLDKIIDIKVKEKDKDFKENVKEEVCKTFIEDNYNDLLKRIYIEISSLNKTYQEIINIKNKKKVKVVNEFIPH